jgi:superfamily II DNA or RNA helicase
MRVGIEMGRDEAWRSDDIVVAGVQTIGTEAGRGRLGMFNPDEFGAIVCDEAHHAIAGTYKKVFEHFGLFDDGNEKLLLGVTATPNRGDGRGLEGVFQKIVYNMSILDAIKEGWLCDLKAYRLKTSVDLDRVRAMPGGDFLEFELSSAVNTPRRNSHIVTNWFEYGENRQTVVFCVTIQHAKDLAEAFRSAGVDADCVWGNDPDRKMKLDKHKRGELTVLTNCGVLTEGYDDWQISCILLARPTKSELLFTQMIGRGTRIEANIDNLVAARKRGEATAKPDCIVIDVVDNSTQHRLANTATLFGYEADHDFRGAKISEAGRDPQDGPPNEPRLVPEDLVNGITTLVEEIDLFAPRWSDDLLNRSVLQWFRSGNAFLLPLPGEERICVQHRGSWIAEGIVGGQPFKKVGIKSFPEALAFGEMMVRIHGSALLDQIREEDRSSSDLITPIQERLLSNAGRRDWNPGMTRDQAAHQVASEYEHALNARCVSELPPYDEDQQVEDASVPANSAAQSGTRVLPEPRHAGGPSDCTLCWYPTDELGYAMPLPDSGEIWLQPQGSCWVLSGEICGVKIHNQRYDSLQAAFAGAQEEMQRKGSGVIAAARDEIEWTSSRPTPLQRDLLKNLFSPLQAESITDRAEARHLIAALYTREFDHSGRAEESQRGNYTRELMERYRLDLEGIHETLDEPE